jgi:hypothetical protein
MVQLDQKNFQAIATNSGPFSLPTPKQFNLAFPSDRLIVTVTSSSAKGDWVRAGYIHYVWVRNGEEFLVSTHLCYLATSKIAVIEPLESSIVAFEPVSWLRGWSISIEASVIP